MKNIIFIFLLFSIGIFAQNKIKVTKSSGNVGTKTVDESAIGDGKILAYDLSNDWMEYVSASGISLTTTGTSGASTLVGSTLNIPIYTGGGTSYDHIYYAEDWGLVADGVTNDMDSMVVMGDSIEARGGFAYVEFEAEKEYYMYGYRQMWNNLTNVIIEANNSTWNLDTNGFVFTSGDSDYDQDTGGFPATIARNNIPVDLEPIAIAGNLWASDFIEGIGHVDVQDTLDWYFIKRGDLLFVEQEWGNIEDEVWASTDDFTDEVTTDWGYYKSLTRSLYSAVGTDTITVTCSGAIDAGVGQSVVITDVGGMTDLNGTWTIIESGTGTFKVELDTPTAQTYTSGGKSVAGSMWIQNFAKDTSFVEGIDYTVYTNTDYDNSICWIIPLGGGNMKEETSYYIQYSQGSPYTSGVFIIDHIDNSIGRLYFQEDIKHSIPMENAYGLRYVPSGGKSFEIRNVNIQNGGLRIGGFENTRILNSTVEIDSTIYNYFNEFGNSNGRAYYGFAVAFNKDAIIDNCDVSNLLISGLGYGLHLGMGDKITVSNCNLWNNRHSITTQTSGEALWLEDLLVTNSHFGFNGYTPDTWGSIDPVSLLVGIDSHGYTGDNITVENCTSTGYDSFINVRSTDLIMRDCDVWGGDQAISIDGGVSAWHDVRIDGLTAYYPRLAVVTIAAPHRYFSMLNSEVAIENGKPVILIDTDDTGTDNGTGQLRDVLLQNIKVREAESLFKFAGDGTLPITKMVVDGVELGPGITLYVYGTGFTSDGCIVKQMTVKNSIFEYRLYNSLGSGSGTIVADTEWRFLNNYFLNSSGDYNGYGVFWNFAVDKLTFNGNHFIDSHSSIGMDGKLNKYNEFIFTNNIITDLYSRYDGLAWILLEATVTANVSNNTIVGSWATSRNGFVKMTQGTLTMNGNDFDMYGSVDDTFMPFLAPNVTFNNNTVRTGDMPIDTLTSTRNGDVHTVIGNTFQTLETTQGIVVHHVADGGSLVLDKNAYLFEQSGVYTHKVGVFESGSWLRYGTNTVDSTTTPFTDNGATLRTFESINFNP